MIEVKFNDVNKKTGYFWIAVICMLIISIVYFALDGELGFIEKLWAIASPDAKLVSISVIFLALFGGMK